MANELTHPKGNLDLQMTLPEAKRDRQIPILCGSVWHRTLLRRSRCQAAGPPKSSRSQAWNPAHHVEEDVSDTVVRFVSDRHMKGGLIQSSGPVRSTGREQAAAVNLKSVTFRQEPS
ncbi:unnamed protein product [Pleuronectes platessa]|uniref:Uncharacterized protein n=1 Tax=Pleuronectes platessa TaxID=8262 RepID=A0A9N7TVU1_PLEPL|nr:unnamed protein product [Pleuronectes platessa]